MGNNASAPRAPLETLDAAGVHALVSSLGAASADVADKLRAIDVDGAYLFHISDADLEGTLDDLGVTPLQRRFLAAKLRGALGRRRRHSSARPRALVDLVIVVEERRTAGILESGRRECAELLEVSGGEDFVRVVGEEDNAPCCGVKIFDPDHPLIENFELLIMFILIFVFVTLPLCLAFERVERQLSDANFVCDLIFCVDVLKNCNTGYADDTGAIVMDRRRVLKNYLRTWFFIDFVSSVPADRIMDAVAGDGERGGDVVGGKKLVKQVRDTFVETIEYYKIHVSDATLKLIRLFLTMLTLSHWGSCLMFILLKAYDYPAESWAALGHRRGGDGVARLRRAPLPWGIYKTLLLVLNCAYADFPSAQVCFETSGWCTIESWMTLVGVFLGWFLNMIFISTITSILVSMDVSTQEFEEQIQRTNDYMRGLRLPTELRDRIRDYYYQRWKEGSIFDETLILERLSPELCHEIMRYKTRDLVKKGETGESLFFVDAGLAEILAKAVGDQVVKLIADGCFFGECSLMLKCRCTATVRAKTVLSCYAVGDEDLDEILEDHADMREYLAAVARKRAGRLARLHLSAARRRGRRR
ncbi:voltage-gated potassium channel [Aureococcus anophagefferens]|nr:voltage-gated potassium channel [Aureococcus anophagefferens]